jgi:hypothetical protein
MKIGTSGWIHPKNLAGIQLMNNENLGIRFEFGINQQVEYDYIMPTDSLSPNGNFTKGIIYGPHIDFRNPVISDIDTGQRIYLNLLSPWLKSLCDIVYPGKNTIALPFPVDVNRFTPREKNGEPVIYFKKRDRSILEKFIESCNIKGYKLFDYSRGYAEEDFKESIAKAPYCVWIGCHESQGFALQETLSSDTPIFVIDAKSLRDEIGEWDNWMPELDLPSTSASYFDPTCGIISDTSKFREEFTEFLNNIDKFRPRDFVIRTVSPEACIKKWIDKLS